MQVYETGKLWHYLRIAFDHSPTDVGAFAEMREEYMVLCDADIDLFSVTVRCLLSWDDR